MYQVTLKRQKSCVMSNGFKWHTKWFWSNKKRVWRTTWFWSDWKRVWHTVSRTKWFLSGRKGMWCHVVLNDLPNDFEATENVCDIPVTWFRSNSVTTWYWKQQKRCVMWYGFKWHTEWFWINWKRVWHTTDLVLKELKTCVTYHMILKQLKMCVIYQMMKRQKRSVWCHLNDITNDFEATENKTSAPNTLLTWLT